MRGNTYRGLIKKAGAIVAVLVSVQPAFASFEQLPTGARQAGMGDAFTAIADDVYSAYYNPAGLAQLHRSEFTAFYSKLYSGLTDGSSIGRDYVAYAQPTATRGTFAASYLSLSLAGLYDESTFALSYAHSVKEKWNVGGSLKFLKKSFGSDAYTANAINSDTGASLGAPDPLFAQNGTSKTGIAMDLGMQYRISKIYDVGVALLNANSPNMALSPSDTDKVPSVFKVGMGRHNAISSIDVDLTRSDFATASEYKLNMGGERWLKKNFGIRGGLGFGQRQYEITTFGFTYRWENLEFDYALVYPLTGIKGTFGTNQFTMTFRFGKKN